jgi:HPt (histidine-containing phosphotransfer) domain-containing protein
MNDYLTKPINIRMIAAALRQAKLPTLDSSGSSHSLPSNASILSDLGLSDLGLSDLGTATASQLIDFRILQELRNLSASSSTAQTALTFDNLLSAYLRDGAQCLETLAQAIQDANLLQIQTIAHDLRSLSLSFGAVQIAHLAQQLEVMTQAPQGTEQRVKANEAAMSTLLQTLQLTWQQTVQILRNSTDFSTL